MECGICNEFFDEDKHCPRMLTCGHSLCTLCINKLLQTTQNMMCPFCRKDFKSKLIDEYVINRNILDFLEQGNRQRTYSRDISFEHMLKESKEKVIREQMKRTRKVKEELSLAVKRMKDLSEKVLETKETRDRVLNLLNDSLCVKDDKASDFKRAQEVLQDKLHDLEETEEEIKILDSKIEAAKNFSEAGPFLDGISDLEKKMENSLQEANDCLATYKKKSDHIAKVKDVMQVTYQINKHLASEGRLMAFQDHPRLGRRYARISVSEDGDLCLHRLIDGQKPPESVILWKHEDLIGTVPLTLMFLDLNVDKRRLGRLLIRLLPEGNFPLYFRLICTGETGPSYTPYREGFGSGKHEIGYRFAYWGEGSELVLPGVDWQKETKRNIYNGVLTQGSLVFCTYGNKCPSFEIIFKVLRTNEITVTNTFGKVVKGLDLLQETDMKGLIHHMTIHDSGVILAE